MIVERQGEMRCRVDFPCVIVILEQSIVEWIILGIHCAMPVFQFG